MERAIPILPADDEWRDHVEIRRPPKDEAWGARTFDVMDPFGNTIFVIRPVR
jgi:hypothetical protein